MKWKSTKTIHAILAALVGLSVLCGADEKPGTSDFSCYPQTRVFFEFLAFHSQAERDRSKSILSISTFPEGLKYALQYQVTEDGQATDWREVIYCADERGRMGASQNSHDKQLTDADFQKLRDAIRKLSEKSAKPPLEHLVIVSFQNGLTWETRTYDSEALPDSMYRIFQIIGERSDSRMKHENRP